MGTWLGITKNGRFAALTNFRDPSLPKSGRFSRGDIVRQFLAEDVEPHVFIENLAENRTLYDGYNVLVGNSNLKIKYVFDTNAPVLNAETESGALVTKDSSVVLLVTAIDNYSDTIKMKIENPIYSFYINGTLIDDTYELANRNQTNIFVDGLIPRVNNIRFKLEDKAGNITF